MRTRDDWRYECLRLLMYCLDAYVPRGFELLRRYCDSLARSLQSTRPIWRREWKIRPTFALYEKS
jgi:hypothetical protein